jgi:hypothetical protein
MGARVKYFFGFATSAHPTNYLMYFVPMHYKTSYCSFHRSLRLLLGISIVGIMACRTTDGEHVPVSFRESQTMYVSVDGNDSGPGTCCSPFQTINFALTQTIPGDTVLVRGGQYDEKVAFPKSGLAGKLITLKAFPNERPIRWRGRG